MDITFFSFKFLLFLFSSFSHLTMQFNFWLAVLTISLAALNLLQAAEWRSCLLLVFAVFMNVGFPGG